MRDLGSSLNETQKRDLLATVIDESERLNRFIANLLDMTKLESGAIVPNIARHDVGEIVGSALRRANKILVHHKVSLELAANLPMLELDAVVFEQVLFNLLDNAAKYAPAGTTISIRGTQDREQVALQLLDEGNGIPPEELDSVFDKFYRAQKGDHVRPGTGLGLAISRGFVEAMHGTIVAPIALTAAGLSSRYDCRSRRQTTRWIRPHERSPDQGSGDRRRAADPKTVADGAEHARL
jgi:two-component system, OmpR family, sensor histidine kinase KdpD